MLRRLNRFLYIFFVPKVVRHRRMRQKRFAETARTPSVPIVGNIALPARVLNDNIAINSIIVVKLDHIGDFLISVEALCRLREAWPQAKITLICDPVNYNFAQTLGIFDNVLSYRFFDESFEHEQAVTAAEYSNRARGIAELELGRHDIAIDLRHDFDSRPCLTYIDARYRVGYATAGDRPFDAPVLDLALPEISPDSPVQLHAETRLNMLVALAIDTFTPRSTGQIARLIGNSEAVLPLKTGRYIVVAPFARSANRMWSQQNFIALTMRIIAEDELAVVVVGSAGEREEAAILCDALPEESCVNLAGAPLSDLPSLVAGSSLYIGNDTGGTHLAALLGVPTLCLYGGVSDPRVWQPLGPNVAIVHSKTPCAYCHINVEEDCPYNQRCMSEIDVETALTQARHLLSSMTKFADYNRSAPER